MGGENQSLRSLCEQRQLWWCPGLAGTWQWGQPSPAAAPDQCAVPTVRTPSHCLLSSAGLLCAVSAPPVPSAVAPDTKSCPGLCWHGSCLTGTSALGHTSSALGSAGCTSGEPHNCSLRVYRSQPLVQLHPGVFAEGNSFGSFGPLCLLVQLSQPPCPQGFFPAFLPASFPDPSQQGWTFCHAALEVPKLSASSCCEQFDLLSLGNSTL